MNFFGNVKKFEAAFAALQSVFNPALDKAGIKTLKVEGKDLPASEAPLADQAIALLAANPTGEHQQTISELHVTNASLAKRIETLESEKAVALGTVSGLQSEKQELTNRSTASEAAVQKLTAELGQTQVQLKAAQDEFNRVAREQAAFNTELSKACIAVGCLQLHDANGAALPLNASAEAKLASANLLTLSEKLKAYQGGLNTAIAATGLSVASLPGAPLQFVQSAPRGILAEHRAITDPVAKARHYEKHKEAIDQAYRELNQK